MTSAISVKNMLKNQAVLSGRSMQEALIAYGLERTVFRRTIIVGRLLYEYITYNSNLDNDYSLQMTSNLINKNMIKSILRQSRIFMWYWLSKVGNDKGMTIKVTPNSFIAVIHLGEASPSVTAKACDHPR